jgi:neopullulanase
MNSIAQWLTRVLIILFPTGIYAQIQHVEPTNWFVGMQNPNLQLLVHGTAIGATTPVINYPGVTLKKSTPGDHANYLFLDLTLAKGTKPGVMVIQFQREGKTIYSYNYELRRREPGSASLKGFDASDVVYLIVPDRFANGDYSNDVIPGMRETAIDRAAPGARHGGDIQGIINHLDYISDMGFTAIWCTPLLENDMSAYSYHGYAITNHYKVDPRFGDLNMYKALSAKARAKGLKLIFDEVLNHIGTGYWWMNELPFRNWLNYPDQYTPTNHRRTTNQDPYAAAYDKDLMTRGWFDKSMPDLNGSNPFLATWLIQNTVWWIETLQLGGIRQDTYGYSDKNFLRQWSCAIMKEYPQFNIVGEEWSLNPLIDAYWQQGKVNTDGYTGCLGSVMDFPLQAALTDGLKEPEDFFAGKGLTKLYDALANDFGYANPMKILTMGDNHDMDRLFMQLNQDTALTMMALTYLLTTRGIPQIFYGTEVLMDNTGHHKNDGLIRSDFPGGWKEDSINAFTGKGLTTAQAQMQRYVKQLLHWRKKNPAITMGKTLHFAPFDGIYVYFRHHAEKMVMVILNKNTNPKTIDTKRFSEMLRDKSRTTELRSGSSAPLGSTLTVAARSATVFEIQ